MSSHMLALKGFAFSSTGAILVLLGVKSLGINVSLLIAAVLGAALGSAFGWSLEWRRNLSDSKK